MTRSFKMIKTKRSKKLKGGAPVTRASSGLRVHLDNTYATWTKALENLPSTKTNCTKKLGHNVIGMIVNSEGPQGPFTLKMLEEQMKNSYKGINYKDLDLGGGDQGKLVKQDEKVIGNLKKFNKKEYGPMLTGGTYSNRLATCQKLVSIIGCHNLIALQPEIESYLTLLSIAKSINSKNTSFFAVGSTDGHVGSINNINFFGNIGIKGTKLSLDDSIISVCDHLNKDRNPNLWLAGSFCFLFLPDREKSTEEKFGEYTDLAQKDLTKPKRSYSFDSSYLKKALPTVYSDGNKIEQYNHSLLLGVLKKCSHIKKIIVGSRK